MSGHSKWANIKHRKGAQDAKRGKIFTRIIKEIQVAVKESGADPESNPRLRVAMQNAKGVNMPKDNVMRAINKATDADALTEETFEGYGPAGIAIFIECLTDNHQRTVANVRAVFNKRAGSLGTNGSLAFIFDRKGVFTVSKGDMDFEEFELEMIDAGAEEFDSEGEKFIITSALEDFGTVQKKLDELNIEVENAQLERIPNTTKELSVEEAKKILRIIDEFEDLDDVQNVYHNLEMTSELEAALQEE